MKFGKLLQETSEGMPEWSNLFLRYKQLKKHLKQIQRSSSPQQGENVGQNDKAEQTPPLPSKDARASALQQEFLQMLNEDVDQFNQFYIDKEEESVIKLQALKDQIAHATCEDDVQALKADLVELHGEMVLMIHWSLINYAAVMKILKKHDKCTGWVLKEPFQPIVLKQPFSSTSIMSQLVKQAEEVIKRLVTQPSSQQPQQQQQATEPQQAHTAAGSNSETGTVAPEVHSAADNRDARETGPSDTSGSARQELPHILRRTQLALHMWQHMSRTASTPSTVLPPEVVAEILPQRSKLRKRASRDGAPPVVTESQGDGYMHLSKKLRVLSSQEVS